MFLCSTDVTIISHPIIHSKFWHIRHYITVTCCFIYWGSSIDVITPYVLYKRMLPVLLFNNCSCSLRVGVRASRVGGKGLGSVLGSAAGSRCLFLGEWYGVLVLWAGQSLNQNLKSKYVNHMKLFMTLEHFSAALTKPMLWLSMHDFAE